MKRLLSVSTIVIAVVVLVLGGLLFFRLAQFRGAVSKLRDQGFPVSSSDLQRPAPIGASDATILINRLRTPLESFEKEMWIDENALSRPVDDEMIQRFNELTAAYPTVFPLIEEISQADELSQDYGGDEKEFTEDLLETLTIARSSARVLAWKMRIETAEGKPDEAIATGLQVFRISWLFDRCPMLLSHLMTNACRGIAIGQLHEIIANHPLSDETRRRLNQELEQQDPMPGYSQSLIGERAFGIEEVSKMGIFQMAYGGKGYLDVIDDEIQNADKEGFEQERFVQSEYSKLMNGWHGESLFPALEQIRNAVFRTRSQLRALRIINALQANPDSESATISQDYLVELGVPKAMTVDTMNGEPMKIKRFEEKWIVYSVGGNLIDDGGDSSQQKDFVLGDN